MLMNYNTLEVETKENKSIVIKLLFMSIIQET